LTQDIDLQAGKPRAWRLSVRSKFLIMMLATSLVSLGAVTYLSYRSGQEALTRAAVNQLTSIREAKKQDIESYFRDIRLNFRAFADVPQTVSAMEDLSKGFLALGKTPLAPARREALEKFYKTQVLPALARTRDEPYTLEELLPRRLDGLEAQALFIAENPAPVGRKQELEKSPVDNAYTAAHARHHPWLAKLTRRLGLDDLMLVTPQGDIVYTVVKEPDFGRSVDSGAVAGTALGQLARAVTQSRRPEETRMIDFAFYWPSASKPAAFLAAPIYRDGDFVGSIVAQISIDAIGAMMNDNGKWRERGLGASGSSYLVGPDLLMRSNFRNMMENPKGFVDTIRAQGLVSERVAERMLAQNTTVLYYPIRNAPLTKALQGRSDTEYFVNQRGVGAFISYAPLDIPDLNWIVVARMDEDEVLAAQKQFNRNVMIVACVIALLVTLIALWLAGAFLRPVTALLDGVERIRNGERKVVVQARSHDEFGDLVGAFNDMSETIRARDEVIEGKSKAYEQLLHRIFPNAVAERMRQGDVGMLESFPQVTVVYAIIEGFAGMAHTTDAARAGRVLGDIVDRMDAVAEAEGVEKVKTVGDHYLAISGLSVARLDSARRALEFIRAASRELEQINRREGLELGLRVGVATGPVQVGLVGSVRFVFDVWGYAASAARRIVYEADFNAVRMNDATRAQLPDHDGIADELTIQMRSIGPVKTYQLRLDAAAPATSEASA
jgi:class 3 adenylate cyclase